MDRAGLTDMAGNVGELLNKLREALKDDAPFVGGIIRGAEEAVLVAYTMLNESKEEDL